MTRKSDNLTENLFKGMRTLLASLPTNDEKDELLQTLRDATNFLQELELLVEAFPTVESGKGLSEGLSRLEVLSRGSEGDNRIKRMMGFQVSRRSGREKEREPSEIQYRVKKLIDSIDNSETLEIARALETSGETLSVLTVLATSLGLRTPSKERKADLIRRIATHVENQRGYNILRGASPRTPIGHKTP